MLSLLTLWLAFAQAGAKPMPATDITNADIQATLKRAIANKVRDTPIRTVNGGGHNVGVALVYRYKGEKADAAIHDTVSEVYQVLDGAGTLVTGGTLVNPQKRESTSETVTQLSGPGTSGSAIQGGVSRRIAKGDLVIIPAGTPHWWREIQEAMTYTVIRIDPNRVIALK